MTRKELLENLKILGACRPAIKWVRETEGSPGQLYRKCKRPDWLAWLWQEVGFSVWSIAQGTLAMTDRSIWRFDQLGLQDKKAVMKLTAARRREIPWNELSLAIMGAAQRDYLSTTLRN
jgi:hypothetical protein